MGAQSILYMQISRLIQKIIIRTNGWFWLRAFQAIVPNIKIGKGVIFKNKPRILSTNESRIIIGNNVVLNSANFGYHVNMFGPVKLMADGPNAEICIGANTRIHGSCLHARKKIVIGSNCLIAANCQIMDSNGHPLLMENPSERINSVDEPMEVLIGDNVWLGTGVVILPGSIIGEGSVITANSVVKGVVPPNSIFGGNPSQLIKQYKS